MFHEPLDPAGAGAVGIAHALGQAGLQIERHALFGALGQIVQVEPHRPEKIVVFGEVARLVFRQHAVGDQLGDIVDPISVFGDPEQRLKIAQTALAVFEVGFDQVAAVAQFFVPGVTLGQLAVDEFDRRAGDDAVLEGLAEFEEQRLIAPQIARLEQRRADGQVLLGEAHAVVGRARRVADLDPQIPQ